MNRWIIATIVLIVILLALALYGYLSGRWDNDDSTMVFGLAAAESKPETCMDDESREKVRKLMLDALDTAFKEKIEKLFEVWLSDDTGQPQRAAKGAGNAVRAYYHARAAAMKFAPPNCSG